MHGIGSTKVSLWMLTGFHLLSWSTYSLLFFAKVSITSRVEEWSKITSYARKNLALFEDVLI